MLGWQPTVGRRRGWYLRAGPTELYVRENDGVWLWYVEGVLGGAEGTAEAARRSAWEFAGGNVLQARAAAAAAPAKKGAGVAAV